MTLPILGPPEGPGQLTLTAAQLTDYIYRRNTKAPAWVVGTYYFFAPMWGIRPDVAVCQMLLETGYLTSDWSRKHNMAGLGVTGEPGKGLSFATYQAGVKAHLSHLWSYAGAYAHNTKRDDLSRMCDPRFDLARNTVIARDFNSCCLDKGKFQ